MTRGQWIVKQPWDREARALQALDWTHVQYSMKPGCNGGTNPLARDCSSTWEAKGVAYHTSDCVGLAMWICGFDRFQPLRFPLYGGWMNTDSLVQAADSKATWTGTNILVVKELDTPESGCLLVYPSYRKTPISPFRTPGHVGVFTNGDKVVHCHGPAMKGPAISWGRSEQWLKHKNARILWLNFPQSRGA